MYKSFISILFVIFFAFSGFTYAEETIHLSETIGRLSIDASISGTALIELPDCYVAKKDMRVYQQDVPSMFPISTQYVCTNDEQGNFLYADDLSNAVTCVINIDISSQIPDLDYELAFMSRDDVEKYITEFMEQHFGISVSIYKTCALKQSTYESLYEDQRSILEQELIAGGKQGATELIQWDSDDVCYIVYMFENIGNIPFFARGETAVSNMEIMPYCLNRTGIMALVFEDGIRYLKIENAWDVLSLTEATAILPAEDAISIYAQSVNDVITLNELLVTDIRLVYGVYDGYAHPFWSFEKTQNTDVMCYTCHDFVDACSGDFIGDGM